MEEEEEEVVVLKEESKEPPASEEQQPEEKQPSRQERLVAYVEENYKKPSVIVAAGVLLLMVIFVPLYLSFDKPTAKKLEVHFSPYDAILPSADDVDLIGADLRDSSIERLIEKASAFYSRGEVEKALDIYEEVALFSESLSLYNLGVARMKNGEYEDAIYAFEGSLRQNEFRSASAINAAVCALNLGNEALFDAYIRIAAKNLQNETDTPLFDYYYTVINYYQNRPFHTLFGATNPMVDELGVNQRILVAKTQLLFDDPVGASKNLESLTDRNSSYVLGLSYARAGMYAQAEDALKAAIRENNEPEKSRSALMLVLLKGGFLKEAGVLISETYNKGYDPAVFAVTSGLKPRLFDVQLAQKHFSEQLLMDSNLFLQTFFYHTPFKVIDTNRVMSELDRATAVLSEQDAQEAIAFLEDSRMSASVNHQVTIAAKLALNDRLLLANEMLQRVEMRYRNSDVLQFNLALTYAQLGEFKKAYLHFRRAYFLNHENIHAGVYSVMLARYSDTQEQALLNEISEALLARSNMESRFLLALLSFYNNNFQATSTWLERERRDKDARYILLDIFAADQLNRDTALKAASVEFLELYPKNLLANMIDLYVKHKGSTIKQFAFGAQKFMDRRDLDFDSLYYGPPVIRDLYIELGLISGNLHKVRELLLEKAKIERNEVRQIMSSLAIVNIFMKNYEESYTIFNMLIDEMNMKDSTTLLYASIASIAADHKANAIALLQLAKQIDPKNYEARYGLGVLYLEAKNPRGAAVEFSMMPDGRVDTKFFDFDIKAEGGR